MPFDSSIQLLFNKYIANISDACIQRNLYRPSALQKEFHDDFVLVAVAFREAKALIKPLGRVIPFNITKNHPAVFSVPFQSIQYGSGYRPAVAIALISLINEELAEIVAFRFRQSIVQAHADRGLIIVDDEGSASLLSVRVGSCKMTAELAT